MAAPISLQVIPSAKWRLSCAMRSGVQGLDAGMRGGEEGSGTEQGTGAIAAATTAAMAGDGVSFAVTVESASEESDGALANGACIGMASLLPRPYWAADRALVRANGQPRDRKP
jgi:hypothetical protein